MGNISKSNACIQKINQLYFSEINHLIWSLLLFTKKENITLSASCKWMNPKIILMFVYKKENIKLFASGKWLNFYTVNRIIWWAACHFCLRKRKHYIVRIKKIDSFAFGKLDYLIVSLPYFLTFHENKLKKCNWINQNCLCKISLGFW